MTPVEFLAPVRRSSQRELVLAAMLYAHIYEQQKQLSPSQIKERLRSARIPKFARINVRNVLARAGEYVHCEKRGIWELTESGHKHVRTILGLLESDVAKAKDITSLITAVAHIANDDVRHYIEEAVLCMKVDARRATIVFAWTGAIRAIHEKLLSQGHTLLNNALQRHDRRARQVKTISDFACIKDKVAY